MSGPPESFTGDWVTPDHPQYAEAVARWATNAERRAKAVAFVKSPQDVATVLRYATQSKLPIAVRGGGHSTSGASSIENGIVVDLSRYLSGARVDPVAKLAYVGGGAIWGTGVLLLGGGYGFLTGEHGLALDNLMQATVVTARGEILTASAEQNSDLFWGIRGAGCNFGVVTEFVLRLHPQRRTVFAGILAVSGAKLWETGLSEKETIFYAQTTDPAGNALALFVLFYNGSEQEGRAHFKPLLDIGPVMDTCKEIPYEELNSIQVSTCIWLSCCKVIISLESNVGHGHNYYMKGVFASGPEADVVKKLVSRIPELSKQSGVKLNVLYELVSTNKVLSVPNHATAHIRGSRISILIVASWDDKATDKLDAVRSAAIELRDIILQGERIIPESQNTGYGNYASEEIVSAAPKSPTSSNGAEALFGENYARLQRLKKEHDPDLMFFKWCPIIPA
ncbi:hypothetical protein BGW80DRAFT_1473780 [Lactifluus volemus]|nr:hypothetical protein BGW80DRAFT_1473780 [Lactifluus volemus]